MALESEKSIIGKIIKPATILSAFLALATPAKSDAPTFEQQGGRTLNGGESTMEMGSFLQKTVSLPQNLWEQMRPSREELVHILREDVEGYADFIYSIDSMLEDENGFLTEKIQVGSITLTEVAEYRDSIDEMTRLTIALRIRANQILTQLDEGEEWSIIVSELNNSYYPLVRELSEAKTAINEQRERFFSEEPA